MTERVTISNKDHFTRYVEARDPCLGRWPETYENSWETDDVGRSALVAGSNDRSERANASLSL